MSSDEFFAMAASVVIAVIAWGSWLKSIVLVDVLRPMMLSRIALVLVPVLATVGLFGVLRCWAAGDVRDDPLYLAMYLVMGLAWMGAGRWCFIPLGVYWRGDILERGNRAALPAVAGALLGLMACYAGANIGDGPGWWCVIVAGGLALGAWLLAWYVLDRVTGIGDAISIDRQPGAGIRLGSYLIASGVICGRGAAGDWHSLAATVNEFAAVWPLLPLLILALLVEHGTRAVSDATSRGMSGMGVVTPVAAVAYLLWMLLALHLVHWPVMGGVVR